MPDTVKGLKEANKALRSEIEELKTQLNEVSQKITSQTNKKPATEDQPHNKAVEFIGKQYDDLDAFRKQASQVIKKNLIKLVEAAMKYMKPLKQSRHTAISIILR
jgi:prefoldin subunit 5